MCGYEGRPRKTKRGSKGMEVFIWTILLVPGPLYSLWRRVGLPKQCPNCGAFKMVSTESDAGQIKQRQMDAELGLTIKRQSEPVAASASDHFPAPQRSSEPRTPIDPDQW